MNQALIITYQSVCPEENTQSQKTEAPQDTHFLSIILSDKKLTLKNKNLLQTTRSKRKIKISNFKNTKKGIT